MSSLYAWSWDSLRRISGSTEPLSPISEGGSCSTPLQIETETTEETSPPAENCQASYAQWFYETYKQWCIDSGRPEKGQKYVLSLNRSIDTFKESSYDVERLLQRLQQESSSSQSRWNGYYFSETLDYYWPCTLQNFDHFAYQSLKALNSPDQYTNIRLQYADFLQNLRSALTSEEYLNRRSTLDSDLVHLLEKICYDKFINTYLFNYWEAFLFQLCGEVPERLDFSLLAKLLNEHNELLHHTPSELRKECLILNYEKLKGTLGTSFDPVGRSNVPKKRSEQIVANQEGSWAITRLAHGTPTLEDNIVKKAYLYTTGSYNAQIIPEYKAFLRAAKEKGERVFYVNLQKTKGLEGDRSFVIELLQNDPEFEETFYCMALPMDGSQFSQLIKKQVNAEEFKRNLLNLFFDEDSQLTLGAAKLPRDLLLRINNNPDLAIKVAKHIRHLIDQVHSLYFNHEELISNKDRQDFIMQFYSDLTDYMISMEYKRQDTGLPLQDHERIRHVIQACKDCKDRGGAKTGIDEAKYILLTYPLDEPEKLHQALYDLYINTLGAYTIKFEEIIPERLVYFTSLLERYGQLAQDPHKIQKIRDAQPDYFRLQEHISARAFDKTPIASVPTIETALTRKDYLKALESMPPIPFKPISFSSQPEKLAQQVLGITEALFAPSYADLSFTISPLITPELQSFFEDLKDLHESQGPKTTEKAIQEIFSKEDDWLDIEDDSIRYFIPSEFPSLTKQAKKLCESPKGKNDLLNMIHQAIDEKYFHLDKACIPQAEYAPEEVYSLFSTPHIIENQEEQITTIHQKLTLIDKEKNSYQKVKSIIKMHESNATIKLEIDREIIGNSKERSSPTYS